MKGANNEFHNPANLSNKYLLQLRRTPRRRSGQERASETDDKRRTARRAMEDRPGILRLHPRHLDRRSGHVPQKGILEKRHESACQITEAREKKTGTDKSLHVCPVFR